MIVTVAELAEITTSGPSIAATRADAHELLDRLAEHLRASMTAVGRPDTRLAGAVLLAACGAVADLCIPGLAEVLAGRADPIDVVMALGAHLYGGGARA
jgi:hypothetical protein